MRSSGKFLYVILTMFVILALPSFSIADSVIEGRILLIYGGVIPDTHQYFINATHILSSQGLDYETASIDDTWNLEEGDVKRYGVIVFGDYKAYVNLDPSKKTILDTYCLQNGVGIFFLYVDDSATVNGGEVAVIHTAVIQNQRINESSGVLRLWLLI